MLITWKQVQNTWVLMRDGTPIGQVKDMVINPHTGEIPALWIKTIGDMKLLTIGEIERWQRDEIFIESPTVLIMPEEFPRIQEVLDQEIPIIGAPVWEGEKAIQRMGKCTDFSFDTLSPHLLSIEVTRGIFFWKRMRIIHRRQILRMNEKGICVLPPIVQEKETVSNPSTAILTGSIPEPEMSESFRHE